MNIYAPSGTEWRRDKENLFLNELPHLLRDIPPSLLVGGDFNSVLTNPDATAHTNYSWALQEFIRGFDLLDMWVNVPGARYLYPLHQSGASRIDSIYASHNLSRQKRVAETKVAAYPDQLAVEIRIALEATTMRRGRRYWKMNKALLCEEAIQEQLQQRWRERSKHTKNYPTLVMWWERVAKMRTKKLFIREGTVKRREEAEMENIYYACLSL